ncbi:MAG: winged helix-turn-helix domain-containing protein [Bdellovibrionota bacterium]
MNLASREISGPLGKRYLSMTEVAILNCLIQSEGRLVTRESLKMQCWGSSLVTNNALDRHIHGVRAAVKKVSTSVKMRSVYGKGYLVEAEVRRLLETEK